MALIDLFKKLSKKQTPKAPKRAIEKVAKKKKEVQEKKEAPQAVILKKSHTAWRILSEPHVTEKSTGLTHLNQYVFKMMGNPPKPEVKKSIEEIYGVRVEKVRKVSLPGKQRRRGRYIGWKSGYNKAIVTLRKGDKIEVLPH